MWRKDAELNKIESILLYPVSQKVGRGKIDV